MKLSTHYYILSLDEQKNRLYEAFRNSLIDIQNTYFPFDIKIEHNAFLDQESKDNSLRDFIRKTDLRFTHYYKQDPLMLVVIGNIKMIHIFEALTTQSKMIIGRVEGDFSATSIADLGMIVWATVKVAMAGTENIALKKLESLILHHKVAMGIDTVAQISIKETGCTLYVEEDYRVANSNQKSDQPPAISEFLQKSDVFDDAVDVIIEMVLANDGNVIFLEEGSLTKFQRIALISKDQDTTFN